jgi:membrane fusion protein (multidrug efflux system)
MKKFQQMNININPLFYFLLTAATIGCGEKKQAETKTETKTGVHYNLAKVEKASLQETVKLPAQLAAYEEVSIFPKVNGYVKTVLADIGSHVHKGQVLMELEAPELQLASVQAKEKYARAKGDWTISKENYERMKQASATKGAVSPMNLAMLKAKADADSTVSNAEMANWQMQQAILNYLQVKAPFDGMVTERNVHPGALVSAEAKDKPMLELKDVEHLRLQVDIPEGVAVNLKENDPISFYLSAFPGKKMIGQVKRISNSVNIQYRSERVELDVYNRDNRLAPGMYADVLLESKGDPASLIVPKSAVVTSTERKYVLAVRNGKAIKVDVSTGNQSADKIAVIGDLQPDDEVIANANDEIKEGVAVK